MVCHASSETTKQSRERRDCHALRARNDMQGEQMRFYQHCIPPNSAMFI